MSLLAVCIYNRDGLSSSQLPAYPEGPVLLVTDSPALYLARLQLISTFACLAGRYNWNAFELSARPRSLRTLALPRVRLSRLRQLQKGEFLSRCKG